MGLAPERLTASQEDIDAVRTAALDYLEGFIEGDPERHARAYHPEAIKRRFSRDEEYGVEGLEAQPREARHDASQPFYSTHLAEASRNFTEMMLALAVLDLPAESPKHDVAFDGGERNGDRGVVAHHHRSGRD